MIHPLHLAYVSPVSNAHCLPTGYIDVHEMKQRETELLNEVSDTPTHCFNRSLIIALQVAFEREQLEALNEAAGVPSHLLVALL